MRRARFTKEGRRFLLGVGLIGLASLNTGNNLIYLIFSLMIALLIIAFVFPFINLAYLHFSLKVHDPLFAKTNSRVAISVRNGKPFCSYSIALEIPFVDAPGVYVPVIRKGDGEYIETVMISKRGKYSPGETFLRTGFPFIFLNVRKKMPGSKQVIVYPEVLDLSSMLNRLEMDHPTDETVVLRSEGEFFSSREYVYGEESRRIDWKSSAKTQKTMVKEYALANDRLATVILDSGPLGKEHDFEKAVSIAASLSSALIEHGYYVRLVTCGKVVPFGNGRAHLFKILDILAEIQHSVVEECPVSDVTEGTTVLVSFTDTPGFSDIVHLCTGVVDARNI